MFAIAVTDVDWFRNIRSRVASGIINFWTPTIWNIAKLQPGDRFYFLLKAPIRKIGGYGNFVAYPGMTASRAWQNYGLGNGVDSYAELATKISSYAKKRSQTYTASNDPQMGCVELSDVVTVNDEHFIAPEDYGYSFAKEIVTRKYFYEEDRLSDHFGLITTPPPFELVTGVPDRETILRKERDAQSAFRFNILANYGHQCCVTAEAIVELLEAAHIQPFVNERSNHPQNGLCLRVDFHRLFDGGLISIAENNTLIASSKLQGTCYGDLAGAYRPHAF